MKEERKFDGVGTPYEIKTYDNKQCKWVKISEDTSTDNIYRMGKKEREFWDKCNKIAQDSHKDEE